MKSLMHFQATLYLNFTRRFEISESIKKRIILPSSHSPQDQVPEAEFCFKIIILGKHRNPRAGRVMQQLLTISIYAKRKGTKKPSLVGF